MQFRHDAQRRESEQKLVEGIFERVDVLIEDDRQLPQIANALPG
jgi:hypothetical protein